MILEITEEEYQKIKTNIQIKCCGCGCCCCCCDLDDHKAGNIAVEILEREHKKRGANDV